MELASDFNEYQQESKWKKFCKKLNHIMFDFHEFDFLQKKSFILTTCNHAFHTECLEGWLKMKRECPTCRTIVPQIES